MREKDLETLVSRSTERAMPLTDPRMQRWVSDAWQDVSAWAVQSNNSRVLGLFAADTLPHTSPGAVANMSEGKWAYVPAVDLLLLVGDGILCISSGSACAIDATGLAVGPNRARPADLNWHDQSPKDRRPPSQRRRRNNRFLSQPRSRSRRRRQQSRSRKPSKSRGRRSRSQSRRPRRSRKRSRSQSRRRPPSRTRRPRTCSAVRSTSPPGMRSQRSPSTWAHDRWRGPVVPSEAPAEVMEVTGEDGEWACRACTFVNNPLLPTCEVCDTPRSAGPQQPAARQWMCAVCTFMNHPGLNECEMCNTGRGAKAFLAHMASISKGGAT